MLPVDGGGRKEFTGSGVAEGRLITIVNTEITTAFSLKEVGSKVQSSVQNERVKVSKWRSDAHGALKYFKQVLATTA